MAAEDTRTALLRAALHIIEREGAEALTLRGLGDRVGVSRQAPYFHFADKRALLAAVAAEGMRRERKALERAIAGESRPHDRLRALAIAHVTYWSKHRRLREIVHGGAVHKSESEELQAEAVKSFALLRDTIAACFPELDDVAALRHRCIIVWGAIRGIGELHVERLVPVSVTGSVADWVGEAVDTLIVGWSRPEDRQRSARTRESRRRPREDSNL